MSPADINIRPLLGRFLRTLTALGVAWLIVSSSVMADNQAVVNPVVTIAGNGRDITIPSNGPAITTAISQPFGICTGPDGALYVCEVGSHVIRRVDLQSGLMTTVAGCGRRGYAGDGGPAKIAQLAGPKGVSLSKAGDLYFADTESHTVRVLRKSSGIVETVIGDGTPGDGPDGDPKHCRLSRPHGVFVSADDWLYIGDSSNHRVRRLSLLHRDVER